MDLLVEGAGQSKGTVYITICGETFIFRDVDNIVKLGALKFQGWSQNQYSGGRLQSLFYIQLWI